ncbi:MAG: tryptophan synthase subunit alpha [Gammaproteobacteria bacterium]|nr:tryptophan synthase subunit alpha [Gammaproteobacteria bacterium]
MSRIASCFDKLKTQGRSALIPYVTAGDSEPAVTVPLMHAMVEAGADLLELGVPFSDPMADGPVIQAASERALAHHVSLTDVINMVAEFRKQDNETPVILMGYLNPIEVMGYDKFASLAGKAGVDGVLTVDIPPEESHDLLLAFKGNHLDPIYLIAPTSTEERIKTICANASGFVYYVSVKGVTGAANLQVQPVGEKINEIRRFTDLPIGVGFGISDAKRAAEVAEVADAVVVGSALVKRVGNNAGNTDNIIRDVTELLKSMRTAMDN